MFVTKIVERGEWFGSANYWLFPRGLEEAAVKKLSEFKRPPMPKMDVVSMADFRVILKHGTATQEEVANYDEAVRKLRNAVYNSQPVWRLNDLVVKSRLHVNDLLTELVNMTRKTTRAFDWGNHQPDRTTLWRKHGWKHICYEEISDLWESHNQGGWKGDAKGDLLGGGDEVRDLFLAAGNGNPDAVGKIWALFPTVDQQLGMQISLFGPEGPFQNIPEPASVAADLVRTIYEAPDSEQADAGRRAVTRLISASIAKGGRGGRGRPQTKVPPIVLRSLWKMSYCEVRQVREVSKFLSEQRMSISSRSAILLAFYPWIDNVCGANTLILCEVGA